MLKVKTLVKAFDGLAWSARLAVVAVDTWAPSALLQDALAATAARTD
jgi:hypothetical protein